MEGVTCADFFWLQVNGLLRGKGGKKNPDGQTKHLVSHKGLGNLACELVEAQVLPALVLVRHVGDEVGDEETSVLRESLEHSLHGWANVRVNSKILSARAQHALSGK